MLKCSLFAAHLTKSPTVSQDVQTFWNERRITITSYRDINSYYYNGYTTLEVLDFDSSTMSDFRFDVKILKFSQTITNLVTLDFDSWQTPNPNKNLEEVILCPSITEIGYKCFSGYNKLKKINLENIHKLDRYAFDETSISSVTLPIDCTGEFVFLNCKNLKQITFDGERASFDLNLLKGFLKLPRISFTNNPLIAEKNYGIVWLQNNELSIYTETDINEFQIPDEIDSINTVAFSYLTKPLKVIVPPKLSDFMGVEYGETKITSIKYLSEDIYKLSDYAFAFWSKLQTVEFSSNIMALGYGSFGNCTELREINLPDVFAISDSAFYRCIKLEKISVPNVQVIGEYAFWHCDKLTSIEFPKELYNIGQHSFAYCKSLKNINIGNQLTKIPGFAFASTKLETFEITNKIMFVNGSSFAFCRNLKLIVHDDHPIFCVTSHELYIKSSMTVVCVFGLQEEIYEVSEGMKSFDELSLQLSEYDYLYRRDPDTDEIVMTLNSERIPILKLPKSVISLDESAMSYSFYTPFSINKTGYKMINPTKLPEEYSRSGALMYPRNPEGIFQLYKVFTTEMTPASWEHNVPTAVKNTDKLILNRDRFNRYSVINRKKYIEYEYVEVDEKGKEVLINTTRVLAE